MSDRDHVEKICFIVHRSCLDKMVQKLFSLVSVVFVLQPQKHHITTTSLHNWFTVCLQNPQSVSHISVNVSHQVTAPNWGHEGALGSKMKTLPRFGSVRVCLGYAAVGETDPIVSYYIVKQQHKKFFWKKILLKSLFFWFISHEIHFPASSYCA